ncbi:MAG: zf-HC2 domain-containing protein [Acidimicrobiales bacterium]
MRCLTSRELLSARLDGETTEIEDEALDAHLSSCPACSTYAGAAERQHREVRLHAAEQVPDLSGAILRSAGVAPGSALKVAHRRTTLLGTARYGLLVIGVVQILLAVHGLLDTAGLHADRHLEGWDLAFGVGLLVVAWQPERARGLLPMAVALAAVMVATAVLDVVDGHTGAMGEASHLVEVVGVALLWLVAWANGRRAARTSSIRWPARRLGPAM